MARRVYHGSISESDHEFTDQPHHQCPDLGRRVSVSPGVHQPRQSSGQGNNRGLSRGRGRGARQGQRSSEQHRAEAHHRERGGVARPRGSHHSSARARQAAQRPVEQRRISRTPPRHSARASPDIYPRTIHRDRDQNRYDHVRTERTTRGSPQREAQHSTTRASPQRTTARYNSCTTKGSVLASHSHTSFHHNHDRHTDTHGPRATHTTTHASPPRGQHNTTRDRTSPHGKGQHDGVRATVLVRLL